MLCKSIDWFLYDRDLRHKRVKSNHTKTTFKIFHNNIGKSRYVNNYLLECDLCEIQYVGRTDILLQGQDLINNVMFTLIEMLTNKKQVMTENIKETLMKPSGLNQKLNQIPDMQFLTFNYSFNTA